MYPSSFFSYLTSRDDDGAPLAPASTTTSFSSLTTVPTTAPVPVSTTRTGDTLACEGSHDVPTTPAVESHFSPPNSRVHGEGSTGLSDHFAGVGSAVAGESISSRDRSSMLKKWGGIIYYSCRDVALESYRFIRNVTAAGLKKVVFEAEPWSFFNECPSHSGMHGPFAALHRCHTRLATTRSCTWMLPGVQDAPLVLHIAVLLIGFEAVQAASFYFRYRKAVQITEATYAEASEEAGEADNEKNGMEDNNNDRTARTAVDGSVMSAQAGSELSTSRTARARLPRGSSRSLHRLCSYWALIEKAVRQAPQKHAGVPTTTAELGRFFGGGKREGSGEISRENNDADEPHSPRHQRSPANGTPGSTSERFNSDGVPRGAEKVLVLPDELAFPVIHRSYDKMNCATAIANANATVASSMDAMAPMESALRSGINSRNSGGGLTSIGVSSPPLLLPPMHPASPDAAVPSRRSTPTPPLSPPPATIVLNEVAQPWQVFHSLWTDTVRYSVNYTEIRQLLLGCNVTEIQKLFEDDESSCQHLGAGGNRTARDHVFRHLWRSVSHPSRQPSTEALSNNSEAQIDSPFHNSAAASFSAQCTTSPSSQTAASPRFTDGRVCVVCMALTWYLSLIREVYDAVVVHQDVQRCADALDELEEYQRCVYQRGVEVGAEFFEEALNYAMPPTEEPNSNTNSNSRSNTSNNNDVAHNEIGDTGGAVYGALPRRLLLPQVSSGGVDAMHDVSVQPLPFSPPPSWGSNEDAVQQHGLASSANPLSFGFSSYPTLPMSVRHDRSHYCVVVRGASPRACWAELTAALAALLRRRRLMELACVRSLFCYMYTGSTTKVVSFTILALLTSLSSRISALGQATREAIASNLDVYYRSAASQGSNCNSATSGGRPSGDNGFNNEGTPAGPRIIALFVFECTRLAVNTVLSKTTNEYITLSASQRRNTVKAELYEALTRMPLAFFDLHSYDEVEQIVYYVNDIEGVEVHVHNYLCGLITSLFAVQHALRQLPFRARVLVGVTVAASLGVKYIGQRVTTWTQAAQRTGGVLPPWLRGCGLDGTISANAELDAQVEENMDSNARQGGVMLRGLDIVAVLPQLRPYAADLSLMRWWTNHTRMCGAASGSTEATTLAEGLMVLPRQLYGKMLPALGAAVMTFADWVLPTVVSSYGASMAFSGVDALSLSNRLIEAMKCVGDTVDAAVDARRVAEVVLVNAYKANVLEKVLDQRRWEPTTMDFMKSYAYNAADGEAENRESEYSQRSTSTYDNDNTDECGEVVTRTQTESGQQEMRNRTQHRLNNVASTNSAAQHQQACGKSFRRASTKKESFSAQAWRHCSYGAAWLMAHSPPATLVRGTVFIIRGGMRWLGFATEETQVPSALAGASMDRKGQWHRLRRRTRHLHHHRRQHRAHVQQQGGSPRADEHQHQQHLKQQQQQERHTAQIPEELPSGGSVSVQNPFLRAERYAAGGGSVSDGNFTEAYNSDVPLDSRRVDVSSMSSSAASYSESVTVASSCDTGEDEESDADDLSSEAAAAAAATALAGATVHAVTVQNLQFYYPTAPTVPVFPKPITCAFTLQSEEWLSPSLTSPSSQSSSSSAAQLVPQMRGRLVCLVGPSGHGKSTLLSLLLGMYTHYGSPGEGRGGVGGGEGGAFTGSSHAAWGSDNNNTDNGETGDGFVSEDSKSTVSFGSPRLADSAALPCLPTDIFLTLHLPRTSYHRHGGRSTSTTATRGVSGFSGVSIEPDLVEEQLSVSVIPRDILRGNLFSFVPQSPVIFSGATIAHNISLENFISLEQEDLLAEIAQCAAWAHCEYIQRFPQGLMTYIADSGTGAWSSSLASAAAGSGGAGGCGGMVRLSGGQAQRLMMARALFHGRRGGTVLVMDEPTASLDHEVKMEILEEWRELLDKGIVRGMICATHDSDLIDVADEVVRLP